MPDTGEGDAAMLAELRARIDRIDEAMHTLLMERGSVIDALIRAKGAGRPGAAFRPQREAEMMRRLARRHSGRLPLTTAEHLWRDIIATFTSLQAPYGLVVEAGTHAEALRDLARFYFGFSVPLRTAAGPDTVIAAVAASGRDLGLIAAYGAATPWWRSLGGREAPRIMALLPFIAEPQRPVDTPALIISPPLADPTPPDLRCVAARIERGDAGETAGDAAMIARCRDEALLAVGATTSDAQLYRAGFADIVTVGGVARGITTEGAGSVTHAPLGDRVAGTTWGAPA